MVNRTAARTLVASHTPGIAPGAFGAGAHVLKTHVDVDSLRATRGFDRSS
jgi:hypothetical protein